MAKKITDEQPRIHFDCSKCPAFCCSIYERVIVTNRDLKRLAKHFGQTVEKAEKLHTKIHKETGERILRRKKDVLFEETCKFLDQETRGCTIYHGRPEVCREYPDRSRCVYYDVLQFERKQQDDINVLPIFQITFRETKKVVVSDENSSEEILEWKQKQ
jgi:Fe-S-cluster containining protein